MLVPKFRSFLFAVTFIASLPLMAQQNASDITGVWQTEDQEAHVSIYLDKEHYVGKIVWLKNPVDKNGKPYTDDQNPEPSKRNLPLLNLKMLHGFIFDTKTKEYNDGHVYDSRDGKTYSGKLWLTDKNTLKMRGYIAFFYRTETWIRVKP